jgi:hypothetical protein
VFPNFLIFASEYCENSLECSRVFHHYVEGGGTYSNMAERAGLVG